MLSLDTHFDTFLWFICSKVIQRRIDDSVNFDRNWKDYEVGFGDTSGNYWIGRYMVHCKGASPHLITFL